MRGVPYIICVLVFAISCGRGIEKPDNLISKSKMVDVIVDLTLLNSAPAVDKSVLEKKGIKPEAYVYMKYNIDSLQFVESNNYYSYNIDDYQDIYGRVKTRLNQKKEAYKKQEEKERLEKKKRDSIRVSQNRKNKGTMIKKANPNELKKISRPSAKKADSLQK